MALHDNKGEKNNKNLPVLLKKRAQHLKLASPKSTP